MSKSYRYTWFTVNPLSNSQNLQDDQKAELETYVQTRAGLNDLYSSTQRNLDTESRRRSQLEQELELLKTSRAEKEVGQGLILNVAKFFVLLASKLWKGQANQPSWIPWL